jgi:hypothetical protein
MPIRSHPKSLIVATAVLAVLPAPAMAPQRDGPVKVVATIVACGGQSLTIAAGVEPTSSSAAGLEALRRAHLRLKFEAAPLYGRTRRKREVDLGRTTSARRAERFANLRAQSYSGIVRYSWVRGKRTVMKGVVRTERARIAGRRGKAFCSLRVGKRPVDRKPPMINSIPPDGTRQQGPIDVRFFVFDNLSGVKLVVSRVDGGPFVRGRANRIEGVGTHVLEYSARDAAGNQSPLRASTLYIDP